LYKIQGVSASNPVELTENRAHLAPGTGTPDSSGNNLRLAHICRMKCGVPTRGALQFGGGNKMRPGEQRTEDAES